MLKQVKYNLELKSSLQIIEISTIYFLKFCILLWEFHLLKFNIIIEILINNLF